MVVLLATLLAAYWAPRDDAQSALSTPARPQRQPVAATAGPVALPDRDAEVLEILPRTGEAMAENVFAAPRPVQPVAAPVAATAPPPPPSQPVAPVAPPPPFQVLGRAVEDGQVTLFLRWGDRTILAKVGDTVEGQYRLDSEDGRILQIRYLPLDQPQHLTISAGK
ncbi:hypothetical protein GCM10027277_30180 [Pseudoduganella ginsengisoli]